LRELGLLLGCENDAITSCSIGSSCVTFTHDAKLFLRELRRHRCGCKPTLSLLPVALMLMVGLLGHAVEGSNQDMRA
jgi:hypothetical protein